MIGRPEPLAKRLATFCAALCCAILSADPVHAQSGVDVITLNDRVTVVVDDEPALNGQYVPSADGSVLFPLVGIVRVVGLAPAALADDLARRLSPYLRDPRVHIGIGRQERVFVSGAVERPGMYDLTRDLTLLELLVRAGYNGVSEVVIVRRPGARSPVMPGQAEPLQTIRVNLRELEQDLERADLSRNLRLEAGDTLVVPATDANAIYVSGSVRHPGAYSVPHGTTVRRALTLAGWITPDGSLDGLRINRLEAGRQKEHAARLDDRMQPGDTLLAPRRQAHPTFSAIRPGIATEFQLGRTVTLTPTLSLARFGIDSLVIDSNGVRQSDFVIEVRPHLGVGLDLRRVRLAGHATAGWQYYRRLEEERAPSHGYGVSGEFALARPVSLTAGYTTQSSRDRLDEEYELDRRVTHKAEQTDVGLQFAPGKRLRFNLSGTERRMTLPQPASFVGEALETTLTSRIRSAGASASLDLTPATTLDVSLAAATHRFSLSPDRDANRTQITAGATFRGGTLVSGRVYAGVGRNVLLGSTAPTPARLLAGGELWHTWRDKLEVGARGQRSFASPFQSSVAFSVTSRYAVWIRRSFARRYDASVQAEAWRFDHTRFTSRDELVTESAVAASERAGSRVRYSAQLGVLFAGSRVGVVFGPEARSGTGGYDSSNTFGWNVVYNLYRVPWR